MRAHLVEYVKAIFPGVFQHHSGLAQLFHEARLAVITATVVDWHYSFLLKRVVPSAQRRRMLDVWAALAHCSDDVNVLVGAAVLPARSLRRWILPDLTFSTERDCLTRRPGSLGSLTDLLSVEVPLQ
jgi:hypothetical protein